MKGGNQKAAKIIKTKELKENTYKDDDADGDLELRIKVQSMAVSNYNTSPIAYATP